MQQVIGNKKRGLKHLWQNFMWIYATGRTLLENVTNICSVKEGASLLLLCLLCRTQEKTIYLLSGVSVKETPKRT